MLQKTTGIVLHSVKYSDVSSIVTVYTRLHGRLSLLVPLHRSRHSGIKAAFFQPLSSIAFEIDYRSKVALHRIRNVQVHQPCSSIPFHPAKSAIALFLSEFLYRVLRQEEEDDDLFDYIFNSIMWLDVCSSSFANFHLVFLLHFLRFVGLYPNLDAYRPGCLFDLINGCFVATPPMHTFFLSEADASRVIQLMRMNYDTMHLFQMNRVERGQLLSVILNYYRLHLPDMPELKSVEVLQSLSI